MIFSLSTHHFYNQPIISLNNMSYMNYPKNLLLLKNKNIVIKKTNMVNIMMLLRFQSIEREHGWVASSFEEQPRHVWGRVFHDIFYSSVGTTKFSPMIKKEVKRMKKKR